MIERSVSVYDRGADGVYIHASAYTHMGGLLAVPPFEHVKETEKTIVLWRKIAGLLAKTHERVPHPKQWNQLDAMYEMADCKGWGQFARRAAYCDVDVVGEKYVFTPGQWDGKGFNGIKSKSRIVDMGADDATCQEALFGALSDSRNASF